MKTWMLRVRMNEEEREDLVRMAGGVSLSTFVRGRVFGDAKKTEKRTVPVVPVNGVKVRKFGIGEVVLVKGREATIFGNHTSGGYVVTRVEDGIEEFAEEDSISRIEPPEESE